MKKIGTLFFLLTGIFTFGQGFHEGFEDVEALITSGGWARQNLSNTIGNNPNWKQGSVFTDVVLPASSFAFAGVEPEIMGYGPVPSTLKALKQAGLTIEDIGAFEINEAFAVQVIAFLDHFGIADDDPRVNPYGGAIAVGHPLASSGVRLMLNLARTFEAHPEVRYGITTMCIGLGMGGTVIWENPNFKGAK